MTGCPHGPNGSSFGTLDGLCPQCLLERGFAAPAPAPLTDAAELQRALKDVEVLALIGRGGMGVVYKARQRLLDRVVALKILPPRGVDGGSIASRFAQEARVLARLSHPNVVAVHDYGVSEAPYSFPFFTMDFVDGINLRQHCERHTPSLDAIAALFGQLCDGLQHAHDRGVVHRDIKPENILIDAQQRVKLTDFGIAHLRGDQAAENLTRPEDVLGTPHYMAPEVIDRRVVDHRADVFSLGVVLYEMITRKLPIGRFPRPSQVSDCPATLDRVIFKALQRNPNRRFRDVASFGAAVQRAVDGRSSTIRKATPALRRQRLEALARRLERKLGPVPGSDDPKLAENPAFRFLRDAHDPRDLETLQDTYEQLQREEDVIRVGMWLARIYRIQGRHALAIKTCERLLLRLPQGTPQWRQVRHDLLGLRDVLVAMEELIRHDPKQYRMLETLKHYYSTLEDHDQTERISRLLVQAYLAKQKWELAMVECRGLLVRKPEDAEVQQALACARAEVAKGNADPQLQPEAGS